MRDDNQGVRRVRQTPPSETVCPRLPTFSAAVAKRGIRHVRPLEYKQQHENG